MIGGAFAIILLLPGVGLSCCPVAGDRVTVYPHAHTTTAVAGDDMHLHGCSNFAMSWGQEGRPAAGTGPAHCRRPGRGSR
jgi:hypothetical protein